MEQLDLLRVKPSVQIPTEPIRRSATIVGDHRYDLTRAWGSGPPICFVMLNPSVADGLQDDPTIWNIMCRSLRWGFGSLVVVNVYSFRSSSPAEMKKWRRAPECSLWENADRANEHMRRCGTVMAAWGAHALNEDIDYLLGMEPPALHCLGTNNDGSPRHPLSRGRNWVPMSTRPIPYTFEADEGYH